MKVTNVVFHIEEASQYSLIKKMVKINLHQKLALLSRKILIKLSQKMNNLENDNEYFYIFR